MHCSARGRFSRNLNSITFWLTQAAIPLVTSLFKSSLSSIALSFRCNNQQDELFASSPLCFWLTWLIEPLVDDARRCSQSNLQEVPATQALSKSPFPVLPNEPKTGLALLPLRAAAVACNWGGLCRNAETGCPSSANPAVIQPKLRVFWWNHCLPFTQT